MKKRWVYVTRDFDGGYNLHSLSNKMQDKKVYRSVGLDDGTWWVGEDDGFIPACLFHALFRGLRLRPGAGPVLVKVPVTLERGD